MAPKTLLDLPNEMLVAIFTTLADDAATTDALSASCRTLRQLWTSSAEFILYRSMPFYTGARDVALAQDYLDTQDLALVQNYRKTSPLITPKSTPKYSHFANHPLTPAPSPNVLVPCQGIQSKHISLIQKLAQKAQRLCDLVDKHLLTTF